MARDAALVSTWGASVRGREAKSLEVFMEFLQYWGKQAAEGRCSEPEPYIAADGSTGMAIVRGRSDVLMEIATSDEALKLIEKGQLIVEDLKTQWYFTGEDEVQRSMSMFVESGQELGLM
ncbi:MAG: hypothetical protein ABR600_03640 [Actinomycetota bacterium]